jgi:hypothetical protein
MENSHVTLDSVQLCIAQLKELLNWFWRDFLHQPLPQPIADAFNGNINQTLLLGFENSVWDEFYISCNSFSSDQKYILIAPPNYGTLTENQLAIFARVRWHIVFDFNPHSKDNGLQKAMEAQLKDQQIRPITIEQKDQKEVLNNSPFSLNWVYANGITALPSKISTTERNWRSLKYAEFIAKIAKEYVFEKITNITLISLWDEIPYLKTIIQAFDENIANQSLIRYIIPYQNKEKLSRLKDEFEQYNAKLLNIAFSEIVEGIDRTIISKDLGLRKRVFQVPARDGRDTDIFVDISNLHYS